MVQINYNKNYYIKNKKEIIKKANIYRKNRDNGLYNIFQSMKRRCKYPSQHGYKWYGGKGIKVEWNDYNSFKNDMYKTYLLHIKSFGKRQTTIGRINSKKNYCIKNCKWQTYIEQNKGVLGNKKIRYGEKITTVSELCKELNITKRALSPMIYRGFVLKKEKVLCNFL